MKSLNKPTFAVELEFALETSAGKQINYINKQIASDIVIKIARQNGLIDKFPTLKPELDACQLEITTDGYAFSSIEVADSISEYYYHLNQFVKGQVSEMADMPITLSSSAMPNEKNFEPVTSLGAPHYPIIDGILREKGLNIRRGTNVRGIHVHAGTFEIAEGVAVLNEITLKHPNFFKEIQGMFTPERITTINNVVDALGEHTNHKICHNPSKYNPGHSYMRYTKYGTLEFRHFDLGVATVRTVDEIHTAVLNSLQKVEQTLGLI